MSSICSDLACELGRALREEKDHRPFERSRRERKRVPSALSNDAKNVVRRGEIVPYRDRAEHLARFVASRAYARLVQALGTIGHGSEQGSLIAGGLALATSLEMRASPPRTSRSPGAVRAALGKVWQ